jgi:hypothetical protein
MFCAIQLQNNVHVTNYKHVREVRTFPTLHSYTVSISATAKSSGTTGRSLQVGPIHNASVSRLRCLENILYKRHRLLLRNRALVSRENYAPNRDKYSTKINDANKLDYFLYQ